MVWERRAFLLAGRRYDVSINIDMLREGGNPRDNS